MAKKTKTKTAKKTSPVDPAERQIQDVLREAGPQARVAIKKLVSDPSLDRVLARLHRQGKVRVVKGRWMLTTLKVCPKCGGKGWV